ncbi:restriction endonuclease subunit S [Streptobacillus felis]|uniref:Restriction endonuclease subunit S n=1 Tax=Streptobacillus felis TaxID=1384509 RepID=A0A7Z0PG89_9FUSO|nr:restriction endonuclease subunit S [Streptobacillus felis]NYV27690.1 restriction endonuclease subunit S [Streptobacillus felis]
MNRYKSYKEVELPWLKEVPSHWKTSKLKYFVKSINGHAFKSSEFSNRGVRVIRISDFSDKGINNKKQIRINIQNLSNNLDKYLIKTQDILLCLTGGTVGKNCYVEKIDEKMYINQRVAIIRGLDNINSNFLKYILKLNYVQNIISVLKTSLNDNISTEDIEKILIAFPPLQEQTQIANYLDWKINEIDKLIAKEKEKIRELNDLKKITVSDIFMSKKEKNNKIVSKYEWIGEIPDYYKVYPLKKLCNKIIDGTHQTPQYTSEGVPFLRVTDISKLEYGENINWDSVAFISKEEHKDLYKRCNPEKNDVLVSKNGTIGIPKIVDWNEEVSIFVSLCLLKLNNIVIPEWIFYYFLTYLTEREISYGGKTGTITNLHLNKIREFKIPVPNLSKQTEIVKKINMAINKINNLINKTNEQIQNLESLKQSLISVVVTGQIDVRDVVIPEYEKLNLENDAELEEEVEEDA